MALQWYGRQDMAGLIYPGVNRLDYDFAHQGGYFPSHVESCNDPQVAGWLGEVIHILPVAPRPAGYNPLGVKNLQTEWVRRLGQTGKDCYHPGGSFVTIPNAEGEAKMPSVRCWSAR